jgi:hypothetical protein
VVACYHVEQRPVGPSLRLFLPVSFPDRKKRKERRGGEGTGTEGTGKAVPLCRARCRLKSQCLCSQCLGKRKLKTAGFIESINQTPTACLYHHILPIFDIGSNMILYHIGNYRIHTIFMRFIILTRCLCLSVFSRLSSRQPPDAFYTFLTAGLCHNHPTKRFAGPSCSPLALSSKGT